MNDLVELLKAGKTYGLGAGGLALLFVFWYVAKGARNVGKKAVDYMGEILKQSEVVRKALGEELETAHETIISQRKYIRQLERANSLLERHVTKLGSDLENLKNTIAKMKKTVE